jgi:hypothetical protein
MSEQAMKTLSEILSRFIGKKYICIITKQCLDEFQMELDREVRKVDCRVEDIETNYGFIVLKCNDKRIYVELDHYTTVMLKISDLKIRNL